MSQFPTTQAELLKFLGVQNLQGVSAPRRFTYEYQIDFDTTIVAGGQGAAQVQVDNDSFFIVLAKTLIVYNPAAIGGAAARTPAALESSPTQASNTWPTLAAFEIQISTQTQKWSDDRVNCQAIFGTGASPAWELVPRVIPPAQNVSATLFNNSAIDVRAQLVLHGYRLLRN